MFAFGQVPKDWLPCNGQALRMSDYPALYSILKSTYGGTRDTFNLPNMQCCAPIGWDYSAPPPGTPQGSATVALTADQLGAHSHALNVVVPAQGKPGTQTDKPTPTAMLLGGNPAILAFSAAGPQSNGIAGQTEGAGSLPAEGHPNVHPSLAVQFCICISGMYP